MTEFDRWLEEKFDEDVYPHADEFEAMEAAWNAALQRAKVELTRHSDVFLEEGEHFRLGIAQPEAVSRIEALKSHEG